MLIYKYSELLFMDAPVNADRVFELAAELFTVMSTPLRLKIISSVCNQEKNVSQLLAEIESTQSNLSQHLGHLYRAGVLSRRREGAQVFYRVCNDSVAALCRTVCTQIAMEVEDPASVQPSQRLATGRTLHA